MTTKKRAYNYSNLDVKEIEKLAAFGLTNAEVASFFEVNPSVLSSRPEYQSALQKGRSRLVVGLKRKQLAVAMDGNWNALRWLGENYLGQKPAPKEISGVDGQPIQIDSTGMYEKLRDLLLAKDTEDEDNGPEET